MTPPTKPSPETGEADVKAAREPGERAKALEWLTSGEHGSIHDFDCMTEHGHGLAECDCWVSDEAGRLVSLLASARAEGAGEMLERCRGMLRFWPDSGGDVVIFELVESLMRVARAEGEAAAYQDAAERMEGFSSAEGPKSTMPGAVKVLQMWAGAFRNNAARRRALTPEGKR